MTRKINKNEDTISLIAKTRSRHKQRKAKTKVYYSFLTIILLICLIQICFSALLNITKTISYQTKIQTMNATKDQAEKRNEKLKDEIKHFSSITSLESIARNNLKMAGDDEVLVIINTPEENLNNKKTKTQKLLNINKNKN